MKNRTASELWLTTEQFGDFSQGNELPVIQQTAAEQLVPISMEGQLASVAANQC